MPRFDFGPARKPTKPIGTIARRIWHHMGRHRRLYMLGLLLGIGDAACQSSIPLVFRSVLNRLEADPERFMEQSFWPVMLMALGLIAVFLPMAYFFHVLAATSVARLTRDMRKSLYQHVQRLSADFFQRHKVGEITQRLNHDMDVMSQAGTLMMALLWRFFVIVWALAAMFWVDWRMALAFIALMAVTTGYTRWYLPRIRRMSRDVRDAVGQVSATITEYVGINDLIKSFTHEEAAEWSVGQRADDVRKKTERFIWWRHLFGDTTQVLMKFVAPFALLFVGAWMFSRGRMRYGDLVAFYGFWMIMGGAVNAVLNSFTMMFTGLASADRVFEFYDETPMIEDAPGAEELGKISGEIEFRDVVFNYPTESEVCVLKDLSFRVPAGQRVAIVGPSGAGKSTILQLILRFYDPMNGQVLIDGRDLRTVTQESLRSRIGVVMQESVFMSGTIEENLRFGKDDATEDEIRSALSHADALEFVEEFPDGVETVLGERGVRLSGGQKQRLSIARVFLKNPPILLFDEATSSLDSLAEKQVQSAMGRLMSGRTTIIVAHRIATIQNADTILLLEDGRITGSGRHEQLLASSKLYHDLCRHQQLVAME